MTLMLPSKVPAPGFYYHYKHDPNGAINNYAYEFIGVGFHTEDNARPGEEHFAIYRPLYHATVYQAGCDLRVSCHDARPLGMWMENVEQDGRVVPRFSLIEDQNIIDQLQKIKQEMYN